jgi:hypothetical protein
MGSLALRPGDSLAILEDGFVNRLQDFQFPSFLLFKLRGLDSYPGGTRTHCSCQPSLDAPFSRTDLRSPFGLESCSGMSCAPYLNESSLSPRSKGEAPLPFTRLLPDRELS